MSKDTRITTGTDNVFADLGLPDAAAELIKAQLTRQLSKRITALGLTQTAAAKQLGVNFGRTPKLNASEAASAIEMLRKGKSRRKVAAVFSVHPNAIALLANSAKV